MKSSSLRAGGSPECLDKVNAAREAAGFSSFTQATNGSNLQAPQGDISDGEWKKMCDYLIPVSFQVKPSLLLEEGCPFAGVCMHVCLCVCMYVYAVSFCPLPADARTNL